MWAARARTNPPQNRHLASHRTPTNELVWQALHEARMEPHPVAQPGHGRPIATQAPPVASRPVARQSDNRRPYKADLAPPRNVVPVAEDAPPGPERQLPPGVAEQPGKPGFVPGRRKQVDPLAGQDWQQLTGFDERGDAQAVDLVGRLRCGVFAEGVQCLVHGVVVQVLLVLCHARSPSVTHNGRAATNAAHPNGTGRSRSGRRGVDLTVYGWVSARRWIAASPGSRRVAQISLPDWWDRAVVLDPTLLPTGRLDQPSRFGGSR
jgi:hypothetical protein